MLYSIIDIKRGEEHGFQTLTHHTFGDKMVVNENELRKLSEDIHAAAAMLGGKVLTHSELQNETKKINDNE